MQVLMLPSWYATKKFPYAGIYVREQGQALLECGAEAHLAFANVGPWQILAPPRKCFRPWQRKDENVSVFQIDGFSPPKTLVAGRFFYQKAIDRLFSFYVGREGKPDIIHAHGFLAGWGALFLKQKYGIPVVITEHSNQLLEGPPPAPYRKLLPDIFNSTDKVIAVSNKLRSGLEKITSKPVVVIPNVVDTKLFCPLPGKRKVMDPFKLIFVGSLIKLKNVDILVKAFLQLQKHTSIHFQLHLIGEGPLHGQLKRLIRDLKAEDSVFLWGAQPQASVARLIAEAHVLILPSKEETFGIVLIEAMACGIPVIATRTGGAGELVNKDRGLLIDSKNEGDLIEAIQKMYSQYHQYAPEKIRAFAAEKFGFKVVGNQLMELYRSLTDQ